MNKGGTKTLIAFLIVIILLSLTIPFLIDSFRNPSVTSLTHISLQENEAAESNLIKNELIIFGIFPLIIIIILLIVFFHLLIKQIKKHKLASLISITISSLVLIILFLILDRNIFLFAILPIVIAILSSISLIYILIKLFIKVLKFLNKNRKITLIILIIFTVSLSYSTLEPSTKEVISSFLNNIPGTTGQVVEDIYNFIIPSDISEEPIFGIPTNKTNETFTVPIANDTRKIIPIEEPSFGIPLNETEPKENISIPTSPPENIAIPPKNTTNKPPTTDITTFSDGSKEKTLEVIN